jgi:hypothetical protein
VEPKKQYSAQRSLQKLIARYRGQKIDNASLAKAKVTSYQLHLLIRRGQQSVALEDKTYEKERKKSFGRVVTYGQVIQVSNTTKLQIELY